MILNDDENDALRSGKQRIGIFFRLETDPVVRLWLGFGKIRPGENRLDSSGEEYKGFGAIQNIPSIKQLLNGRAARVEFTISGVSGEILRIASGGDAKQVKGKPVSVGFALMGRDWQLLGPIHWTASYTADYLGLQESGEDPMQPIVRTITLSCGTLNTDRRRPLYGSFTNPDQQARYPRDTFCERTPTYAHGFQMPWPVFG
jgi:hypothetical protein